MDKTGHSESVEAALIFSNYVDNVFTIGKSRRDVVLHSSRKTESDNNTVQFQIILTMRRNLADVIIAFEQQRMTFFCS